MIIVSVVGFVLNAIYSRNWFACSFQQDAILCVHRPADLFVYLLVQLFAYQALCETEINNIPAKSNLKSLLYSSCVDAFLVNVARFQPLFCEVFGREKRGQIYQCLLLVRGNSLIVSYLSD